nr:MAG TPA: cysteine-rich protein [Caudoviricetes sp.]
MSMQIVALLCPKLEVYICAVCYKFEVSAR